jgi:hypothetical protein
MNALTVAQNSSFLVIAMTDALELLAKKSGISYEALVEQFPTNKELQTRVAEMVSMAARVTADAISR